MNKKRLIAAALIWFAAAALFSSGGDDPSLREWREFSRTPEAGRLASWIKGAVRAGLTGDKFPEPLPAKHPSWYGRFGVFITLMKKNKVRGCYGYFHPPSSDLAILLKDCVRGALRRDPRYSPPDISEADEITPVLTIASSPVPTESIHGIDLTSTGIFLRCGQDESIVLVPAELKTSIAVEKTAKKKNCQIEIFSAVTIR